MLVDIPNMGYGNGIYQIVDVSRFPLLGLGIWEITT